MISSAIHTHTVELRWISFFCFCTSVANSFHPDYAVPDRLTG